MLRAIDLTKPVPNKKLILDLNQLVAWIKLVVVDTRSTFQVCHRMALILMLLASGGRIQNLTLLRIDRGNLLLEKDFVPLWTDFG